MRGRLPDTHALTTTSETIAGWGSSGSVCRDTDGLHIPADLNCIRPNAGDCPLGVVGWSFLQLMLKGS